MTRTVILAALIALTPAVLAGCSCSLEDAHEIAARGEAKQAAGSLRDASAAYAEAAACASDILDDDPRARFLRASLWYRIHASGGPEALPATPEGAEARKALADSGKRDFLELALVEIVALEELSFSREDEPSWVRVDADRIPRDLAIERSGALAAEVPARTYMEVPKAYAETLMELAALEVARGFAIQAWRTAIARGASPDEPRNRLAEIYRKMADGWERMAAVEGVGLEAAAGLRVERDRCAAWAQRVSLLLDPDDLHHPVEREMLSLSAEARLHDMRSRGVAAQQEKQSGNTVRARAYFLECLAHASFAVALGIPDGPELKSAMGYAETAVKGHFETAR